LGRVINDATQKELSTKQNPLAIFEHLFQQRPGRYLFGRELESVTAFKYRIELLRGLGLEAVTKLTRGPRIDWPLCAAGEILPQHGRRFID
jgi:hypothetical protein